MIGIEPMEWASFKALGRRLGWWTAIRVGMALRQRVDRGEPFEGLPPSDDPKERASRDQIASAVVLYRLLQERMSQPTALEIVAEVVEAGAHVFLKQAIGPLSRTLFDGLDEAARYQLLDQKVGSFPNTIYQIEEAGTDRVRFTVSACSFVRLCREAKVPELTPVFCAVDASYFGGVEPAVSLERPTTLAQGGPCCDFRLQFVDEGPVE